MDTVTLRTCGKSFIPHKENPVPSRKSPVRMWIISFIFTFLYLLVPTLQDFHDEFASSESRRNWLIGRIVLAILTLSLIYVYQRFFKKENKMLSQTLCIGVTIFAGLSSGLNIVLRIHTWVHQAEMGMDNTEISALSLGNEAFWVFLVIFCMLDQYWSSIIYIIIVLGFKLFLFVKANLVYEILKVLVDTCLVMVILFYSHRKQVESQAENRYLKQEDHFHKSVLDSLPDAVLVYLRNGTIKFQNDQTEKMFSWDLYSDSNEFHSCFSHVTFRKYGGEIKPHQEPSPLIRIKSSTQLLRSSTVDFQTGENMFKETVERVKFLQDIIQLFKNHTEIWTRMSGNILIFDSKYRHPLNDEDLSIEIKAFTLHSDNQAQLVMIFRDITNQDRLVKLRSENEIYRNNVIASFSHELRTPLNINMGLLEQGMTRHDISNEVKDTIFKPALTSARLLLFVINDILDYSQILSGKFQLKSCIKPIGETIESCLSLFRERIEAKNLKLSVDMGEEAEHIIFTDHNRLSQIFVNLLTNALKFTFKGSIQVQLRKENEDCYRLSVTDTGVGMDEETQEKLRKNLIAGKEIQEKICSDSAGIGLGLFISNAFSLSMSPDYYAGIHFESEPNKGSIFYFYFKDYIEGSDIRRRTKAKTFSAISNEIENNSRVDFRLRGHTTRILKNKLSDKETAINLELQDFKPPVLIVDDEIFNVMILERFCKEIDLPTETALNGQQALDKIQEIYKKGSQVKLVLMDVNMPVMDGYQTTLALRKMIEEQKIEDLVIIGITAYVSKQDIDKCYECGMDEVVNKPLSQAEFIRLMKKYGFI